MYKEGWEGEVMYPLKEGTPLLFFRKVFIVFFSVHHFPLVAAHFKSSSEEH